MIRWKKTTCTCTTARFKQFDCFGSHLLLQARAALTSHTHSDTLVYYATPPNMPANVDPENGSLFIQCLVATVHEFQHKHHVTEMFAEVVRFVNEIVLADVVQTGRGEPSASTGARAAVWPVRAHRVQGALLSH